MNYKEGMCTAFLGDTTVREVKNFELTLHFPPAEVFVRIHEGIFTNLHQHLLEVSSSKTFYFIVDGVVYTKYREQLDEIFKLGGVEFALVSGGTESKNLAQASEIFLDLDSRNISRDVAIVAVGGGVIGDLAGFVASCWYRGVELIHVPTTLLSAVDSCVGGKTGLNFGATINSIGTYHHPSAVLIDTEVLTSLPRREIASGFGEIIKYSLLGSKEIEMALQDQEMFSASSVSSFIKWSLTTKEKFASLDVKESNERLFLNFGHTVGHAIEFSSIFDKVGGIRHGEAVGLGMLAAMRISVNLGYAQKTQLNELHGMLSKWNLPTKLVSNELKGSRDEIIESIVGQTLRDKKRHNKGLRLVLIDSNRNPFLHTTNDLALIRTGVEEIVK